MKGWPLKLREQKQMFKDSQYLWPQLMQHFLIICADRKQFLSASLICRHKNATNLNKKTQQLWGKQWKNTR